MRKENEGKWSARFWHCACNGDERVTTQRSVCPVGPFLLRYPSSSPPQHQLKDNKQ